MAEIRINAKNLQCPGPIVELFKACKTCNQGDLVIVEAKDPGFKNDVVAWCKKTGNELVSLEEKDGIIVAQVKKT